MEDPRTTTREQDIRSWHRFDAYRGRCSCGWECTGDRSAEREHARHVERILAGRRR